MPRKPKAKPLRRQELAALKALVTIYGARPAARLAKIPEGTVLAVAFKHGWKKASGFLPESEMSPAAIDAAELIAKEIAESRQDSQLNLARYTKKASKAAADSTNPLDVARKVRDVAGVFQVLYPPETEEGLIEGAILMGTAAVIPDPEEVEARAITLTEVNDVRPEIPNH
jgi:hypothetical protein